MVNFVQNFRELYKKLLGQTAVYGLSTVLIRVFPFLIAPIITHNFTTIEQAPFVDFYSVAGIITVLLTHGMETSFFRFAQEKIDKKTLVSTCSLSIITIGLLYLILGYVFRQDLANWFQTPDQVNYLVIFLFILSIDAFSTIPSAILRLEGNAKLYTISKVAGALVNYFFVVFFIVWLPKQENGFLGLQYSREFGVGYVFVANLIQSIVTLTIVGKEFVNFSIRKFDFGLWKRIMNYSWPVMVAGLAGIVNQTLDRQFLKVLIPDKNEANHQIAVYGGVYKVATFITVFRQAYQLGIEPYFFSSFKKEGSHKTYTVLMDIFVILSCIIFLGVMVNLQWISELYLRNPQNYEGIPLIPNLMLGAVFLGIYLNLSIWYKLSDQTIIGLYISLIGAAITIAINYFFVPEYGYWASAWAALITFMSMMMISYFWGQKNYPIPYNVGKILIYLGLATTLGLISFHYFRTNFIIGNLFLVLFLGFILFQEKTILQKILKR